MQIYEVPCFFLMNSQIFLFQPLFGCALHLVPEFGVGKVTVHKLLPEHLNLISLPHSRQK